MRGRVQGVFFRDWAVAQARAAGLTGWVRNRADGSVEIHAQGNADAIDALIVSCGNGPPAARVEGIDVSNAAPIISKGFTRRPTE